MNDQIRFDDVIRQGSRYEALLWLKDDGNVIVQFTGWTAQGQLRHSASDTDPVAELHFQLEDHTDDDSGAVTIDGQWRYWLTPTETAALAAGRRVAYTIELTPPGGTDYTLVYLEGVFTIRPELTR